MLKHSLTYFQDKKLLLSLTRENPEQALAWRTFLKRYSKLILKIAWRYSYNYDEVMDKYLFICSKLKEDNYKKLKQFNIYDKKRPKLSTWLTIIIRHLCVDEIRKRTGRNRYPLAVMRLDDFHRKVFDLYYLKGHSISEIEEMGISKLSNKKYSSVSQAVNFIHKSISSKTETKFKKSVEKSFVEFDEKYMTKFDNENEDFLKVFNEKIDRLIDDLPDTDGMIIKLKYWEGLSVTEIAKIVRCSRREVCNRLEHSLKILKKLAEDKAGK